MRASVSMAGTVYLLWKSLQFILSSKPKSFVRIFLFHLIEKIMRKRIWFQYTTQNHDNMHVERCQLYCRCSFNIHLNFTATQSHHTMACSNDTVVSMQFVHTSSFFKRGFIHACLSLNMIPFSLQMVPAFRKDWDFSLKMYWIKFSFI